MNRRNVLLDGVPRRKASLDPGRPPPHVRHHRERDGEAGEHGGSDRLVLARGGRQRVGEPAVINGLRAVGAGARDLVGTFRAPSPREGW